MDAWTNVKTWAWIVEVSIRRVNDHLQVARGVGILLRLRGLPDQPSVWGALRNAGVGVIGTDRVEALGCFLPY